ncbi:MAG: PaaI family thioesterase [Deltaproteobacteria bacterium]|nr:PaaI family thioesterase [Deltaproteobacteria bacterium]
MNDIADAINDLHRGTFAELLGLTVQSASRDEVIAQVTVAPSHHQPHGIVHGGVYASIIESLASIGAALDAMPQGRTAVGLDNHTSFVRATREGVLTCRAVPVTRGRRSQLWDATIHNQAGELVASGRVRLLVLEGDATVAGSELKTPTTSAQ